MVSPGPLRSAGSYESAVQHRQIVANILEQGVESMHILIRYSGQAINALAFPDIMRWLILS
jgi:hypothetical protein